MQEAECDRERVTGTTSQFNMQVKRKQKKQESKISGSNAEMNASGKKKRKSVVQNAPRGTIMWRLSWWSMERGHSRGSS